LVVYALSVTGMVAYTFTFSLEIISVTFVTAGVVGYFFFKNTLEIKQQSCNFEKCAGFL